MGKIYKITFVPVGYPEQPVHNLRKKDYWVDEFPQAALTEFMENKPVIRLGKCYYSWYIETMVDMYGPKNYNILNFECVLITKEFFMEMQVIEEESFEDRLANANKARNEFMRRFEDKHK